MTAKILFLLFTNFSFLSSLPASADVNSINIEPRKSKSKISFFDFGFKAGLFSCLGINLCEVILKSKCYAHWGAPCLLDYGLWSASIFTIMQAFESQYEDGDAFLSKTLKCFLSGIVGSFLGVLTFATCADFSFMITASPPLALLAMPPLFVGLISYHLPKLKLDINAHRGILVDLGFFKRKYVKNEEKELVVQG